MQSVISQFATTGSAAGPGTLQSLQQQFQSSNNHLFQSMFQGPFDPLPPSYFCYYFNILLQSIFPVDVCGLQTLSDTLVTMNTTFASIQASLDTTMPAMKNHLSELSAHLTVMKFSIMIMTVAILMVTGILTIIGLSGTVIYFYHVWQLRRIKARARILKTEMQQRAAQAAGMRPSALAPGRHLGIPVDQKAGGNNTRSMSSSTAYSRGSQDNSTARMNGGIAVPNGSVVLHPMSPRATTGGVFSQDTGELNQPHTEFWRRKL